MKVATERYFNNDIAQDTEEAMAATNSATRPFDRWVTSVWWGSADAEYLRLQVVGAGRGQSLHITPKEVPTNYYEKQPLPYPVFVPANTSLDVYGYQGNATPQAVHAIVEFQNMPPVGWSQTAILYSKRHTLTAGNGSMADGTAQTIPSLNAESHTYMGSLPQGDAAEVQAYSIRADPWPKGNYSGWDAPVTPGGGKKTGVDQPVIGPDGVYKLKDADTYTPAAVDDSAGTVYAYDYWMATGLK